ncbi:MAG: hypothetical protein RLZZ407_1297 [Pseudomonadota bacterium]|jgi:hypothetical protein
MKAFIIGYICDILIGVFIFSAFNYFMGELPIFGADDFVTVLLIVSALTWSRWFWGLKAK